MIQPSRHLVLFAFGWTILGFASGVFPLLGDVWLWTGLGLALLAAVDFLLGRWQTIPELERTVPGRFALGVPQSVKLLIRNRGRRGLGFCCYDGLPEDAECESMPWSGKVPAEGFASLEYEVSIHERGLKHFARLHLRLDSPLRMWMRHARAGEEQSTRVYPNYEPVLRYALLAMANRVEQMGIVKKNRAGLSREFHQLRDYQRGDMLSHIDWKATSKRYSLISRDYQEQRDQTVILALDCGRRMRAHDGGMPQFDHCLNAMLLLAYTALRQGDHVGVIGVGGEDRWLAPVKGVQSMTTILNHLYDYRTSTAPSDFNEATQRLMSRQERRALVVLLSNIRGEDVHQVVDPLRMMRQRHVTILANIRESGLMERIERPSESLEDALEVGASAMHLEEREHLLVKLRAHGVHTVDCQARDLPVSLANAYLDLREMV